MSDIEQGLNEAGRVAAVPDAGPDALGDKPPDLRVLYVDVSAVAGRIFDGPLAHAGLRVDSFDSGGTALAALQAAAAVDDPYRIAAFDYRMHDIDPITLGSAIKSDPTYGDTLLVLLNFPPQTLETRELAEAGFSAVLSEPFSQEAFRNTLNTLCTAIGNGEPPPFLRDAQVAGTDHEGAALADDLDAMKELFASDFTELALLFQSDSLKRIAALHRAAAQNDQGDMIRLVHAFGGSASSMGASSLAFVCKTLEIQLKSGKCNDLAMKVQALESDYAKIDARLQLLLKTV